GSHDGRVDFDDFLLLSNEFGSVEGDLKADFDGDGTVDFADFLLLANSFGAVDLVPADFGTLEYPSGRLSLQPGVDTATILIPIAGDEIAEVDEHFKVLFSSEVRLVTTSLEVVIVDDDA
ncbi:dockerin type I domain-containing protein, partial [Moorena producens]